MKYFFFSFISLLVVHFSTAQEKFFNTDINDLELSLKEEERPVLLFFTAEWCKYCRAMKSDVFLDSSILNLSSSFYTVEFPSEYDKEVIYAESHYNYIPTGVDQGYHEFTETFARKNGTIKYPTLVIIWKEKRLIVVDQYLDIESLQRLLRHTLQTIKE